ncbi:MAG: hypothetical protein ACAF41_10530 [Leptolyngbya sp. BL-A-14]
MVLHNVRKGDGLPLQSPSRCLSVQPTSTLHGRSGKYINLATVGLVFAGVLSITPSALSQSAVLSPSAIRSGADATVQHPTCAIDPQGLMCTTSSHELEALPVSSQASVQTGTMLHPLTNEQMERLSDILLGILYFVLPVGFGLTLFLHDRYQSYRTATLDAQIKLLEKLWEQSPQA